MKIETEFDRGDTIFLMVEDRLVSGKVESISVAADFPDDAADAIDITYLGEEGPRL